MGSPDDCAALVAAVPVFTGAVLAAEYGVDPLGTGRSQAGGATLWLEIGRNPRRSVQAGDDAKKLGGRGAWPVARV